MSNGSVQMSCEASDDILVRQISEGDDSALTCIFMRYKPLLKSAVYKLYNDSFDYDDMFQEATLGLVKAVARYKSQKGTFSAFAKLCVESELISYIRSLQKKSNIPANNLVELKDEMPTSLSDPQDIYMRREEVDDIKAKIKNNLSDFECKVIHCYIMGKSYDAIATELGVTVKSVDNAIQRIRRKFK